MDADFITDQLLPYIGNKRKLVPLIHRAVAATGLREGTFYDAFAGSTVVATTGFQYKDYVAAPIQSGKVDTISATATSGSTTGVVPGATLPVGAGLLDLGEAITVDCAGTLSGTTGSKTIGLWAGSTELGTVTVGLASVGGWRAWFRVGEYTDAAHQQVLGSVVVPGGTYASYHLTPASKTINMATAHTLTIKIATPTHAADEITVYACDWAIKQ